MQHLLGSVPKTNFDKWQKGQFILYRKCCPTVFCCLTIEKTSRMKTNWFVWHLHWRAVHICFHKLKNHPGLSPTQWVRKSQTGCTSIGTYHLLSSADNSVWEHTLKLQENSGNKNRTHDNGYTLNCYSERICDILLKMIHLWNIYEYFIVHIGCDQLWQMQLLLHLKLQIKSFSLLLLFTNSGWAIPRQ